jgi:Transposase DDE domain
MVQHTGVTVAQVQVPADTTETTQVRQLLDEVPTQDGDQVVITADAAHTQRATAEYIAGERGCDDVLTVKANQPALVKSGAGAAVLGRCGGGKMGPRSSGTPIVL